MSVAEDWPNQSDDEALPWVAVNATSFPGSELDDLELSPLVSPPE